MQNLHVTFRNKLFHVTSFSALPRRPAHHDGFDRQLFALIVHPLDDLQRAIFRAAAVTFDRVIFPRAVGFHEGHLVSRALIAVEARLVEVVHHHQVGTRLPAPRVGVVDDDGLGAQLHRIEHLILAELVSLSDIALVEYVLAHQVHPVAVGRSDHNVLALEGQVFLAAPRRPRFFDAAPLGSDLESPCALSRTWFAGHDDQFHGCSLCWLRTVHNEIVFQTCLVEVAHDF